MPALAAQALPWDLDCELYELSWLAYRLLELPVLAYKLALVPTTIGGVLGMWSVTPTPNPNRCLSHVPH